MGVFAVLMLCLGGDAGFNNDLSKFTGVEVGMIDGVAFGDGGNTGKVEEEGGEGLEGGDSGGSDEAEKLYIKCCPPSLPFPSSFLSDRDSILPYQFYTISI